MARHNVAVFLLVALATPCLPRVVVSVDVGTESTRAAVFDANGNKLASHSPPHATFHPQAGWAEQRPTGGLRMARSARVAFVEPSFRACMRACRRHAHPHPHAHICTCMHMPAGARVAFVEPSVLAADIGDLNGAVREVAAAGGEWVHVDVNDGSAICGMYVCMHACMHVCMYVWGVWVHVDVNEGSAICGHSLTLSTRHTCIPHACMHAYT